MTLVKLIQLLKNDEQIVALLGGSHIYATPCTYRGNCIVYNWMPVTSDTVKTTDRLELNIITDTIRNVYLNGGGNLFDEERQKNHRILYFYILKKE